MLRCECGDVETSRRQVPSPGDVLRRSVKASSQVFEEIKLFLRGQPSVLLCQTQSLIEALVMIDFVVLHIAVRILKDEEATVLVFRDMLGQDRIRFHKFVGRLQGALAGEAGDSDSDFDWESPESPESPESESPESVACLMKEATSSSKKAAEAAQILALWARDRPASRAAIARAGAKVPMSQLPQEAALPLLVPGSDSMTPCAYASLLCVVITCVLSMRHLQCRLSGSHAVRGRAELPAFEFCQVTPWIQAQ